MASRRSHRDHRVIFPLGFQMLELSLLFPLFKDLRNHNNTPFWSVLFWSAPSCPGFRLSPFVPRIGTTLALNYRAFHLLKLAAQGLPFECALCALNAPFFWKIEMTASVQWDLAGLTVWFYHVFRLLKFAGLTQPSPTTSVPPYV